MIASAELANRELGWHPETTELDDMVASAWRWHQEGWAHLNERYGSSID
jgi:UDP-glucose 4-epimerase